MKGPLKNGGGAPLILVVEDDRTFQKFLVASLEAEGYRVTAVLGAEDAWDAITRNLPDLVLSDVKLSRMDGRQFCAKLKGTPRTASVPVILLSGNFTGQEDQAEGLEGGADDYLLKPVSGRLLTAKIRSVLHRYRLPQDEEEMLNALGMTVNVKSRTVNFKGQSISLTRKEFDLLTALLKHPQQVLTPEVLLEMVWGLSSDVEIDTDTIKVHISSLRKKLGARLAKAIINVPGVGYKFEA